CLMVGIKGQTKDMITKDMEILTKCFEYGTISVYRNNSTSVKRDNELVHWFMQEYDYLIDDERYDFLYDPTDFGVGE
ncbi:radical SAM protein, partial [Coprobacillus cateniformis]|nr:radical SAM protein [Coprobacillus cateniformis]